MDKLKTVGVIALSVGLGLSGIANAGPRWDRDRGFEDSAKVIDAKPIYERVTVAIPEERCWREPNYRQVYRNNDSYTAPILGAIVGGVVGNRFGGGSGKTALTVAGSLLGASIANDVTRNDGSYRVREVRGERRCEVTERHETHDEIVGYDVTYRYKGHVYRTRMDHDPGKFVPVAVDVRPIH